MFDRLASHLDLPSIPIPDSGLVGFNGYRDSEECWPVWRVTQADWDGLKDYWPRRRMMRKLEIIENQLIDLKRIATEVVEDKCGDYSPKLKAQAFDVCAAIDNAIQACREPQTGKAPF